MRQRAKKMEETKKREMRKEEMEKTKKKLMRSP